MPVLLTGLENVSTLRLHVVTLRKRVQADFTFERNGVMFHVLKVPGGLRAPSLFWVDTLLIKRALRSIRPDLVHAWGTERGEAIIASRLGYPYLITVQGLMNWYKQFAPLSVHQRLAARLETWGLRRAGRATVESSFGMTYLRDRYPRLQLQQIEHAPNPVFHRLERVPSLEPIRLINVGTVSHRKGTDLLLRALDRLVPEFPFELTMVGTASTGGREALRREVSPKLWDRILFKSDLTPGELADELAVATLKVLPTRADTSPNVVKEAVVAGVPVVASRVGGIPDYVFPERNGLLFPPGDLDGLVEALRAAVRHPLFGKGRVDPSTLESMRAYLSPALMAEKFLVLYRSMDGPKSGGRA